MITCVLCTAREEPGFDLLMDSINYNLSVNPGVDFELIVVDKLLWGVNSGDRRQQLSAAIKDRFPFRHITPKPSPWQGPNRKTKKDHFDLNGARNTGIALARGDHIILVDDCCSVGREWLKYHAHAAKLGCAVAGGFIPFKVVDSINPVDCTPIGESHDPKKADHRRQQTAGKATGAWFYGLNISFPLQYALKVNGFDEQYSGAGGSDDCDFGVRIERAGCTILWIPDCTIYNIAKGHGEVCGYWHSKITPKERMLRDGKLHFANELLIQNLLDDKERYWSVGNDFDITQLRIDALRSGSFPVERTVTVDWRDNQPLSEM